MSSTNYLLALAPDYQRSWLLLRFRSSMVHLAIKDRLVSLNNAIGPLEFRVAGWTEQTFQRALIISIVKISTVLVGTAGGNPFMPYARSGGTKISQ